MKTIAFSILVLAMAQAQAQPIQSTTLKNPTLNAEMVRTGFLVSHPDLRYRELGMEARDAGRYEEALNHLKRAARHADKPSQAMIAEMLWKGEGVPQDRAMAYAWMDLAAERGWQQFLVWREQYWSQLDELERERAIRDGQVLVAEYADEVARPRIDGVLRKARAQITGSRTGFFSGGLKVLVPGPGNHTHMIDGAEFYDDRFWNPEKYAAWHDEVWRRSGKVGVGEAEHVPDSGR